MPETISVQDPAVHQHGLETGPAASVDMSGNPTEIRGLDDASGLREAVPEDSKVLQDFGEVGEEAGPAQEGLGMIALGGSEVEVPPLAIEQGFDEPEVSESLAPPAPVLPIQTPEHPEIMQSVFELARNGDVPIEKRIEALETYVRNQEAQEDTRPGETFEQYMDRMDRVTAGQEHLWSPELRYAKETLASLRMMRGPERDRDSQAATQMPEATSSTSVTETIDPAEPEPEITTTQTISSQPASSNQSAQKPNNTTTQTNTSNTNTNTSTNNSSSNTSNTNQQTQTKSSPPTPKPSPSPSSKPSQKNQPANPAVPAAQAAAAAQAGQAGFGEAAAATALVVAQKTNSTPVPIADVGPTPETGKEQGFAGTLSPEDQIIWEDILRINEEFKDGDVSVALTSLEKNFNKENARIVMDRVEESARVRQENGDELGARRQIKLAKNLDLLAGHVFGERVNRAA